MTWGGVCVDNLDDMSLLNQDRRDKKEIVLRSEKRAF